MRLQSSSPTAANELIILLSMLDAIEDREVITVDIPNAFIQTVVENETHSRPSRRCPHKNRP
jgi:hypothetical protein